MEWNKADVLLYDHFNETFWNIVKYQDENFWSEVRLLKKMSRKIAEDCLQPGEHKHDKWKKTVGKLILNKKMDPRMEPLCRDLVQDEDVYLKIFRDLQFASELPLY